MRMLMNLTIIIFKLYKRVKSTPIISSYHLATNSNSEIEFVDMKYYNLSRYNIKIVVFENNVKG